jgi:hypothetical protein
MKRKTLLAVLIALAMLALACGPCGVIGDITGETDGGDEESPAVTQPPDDGPGTKVPPTRPPSDEPPSGKGIKGIPLYPGATEVTSAMPPQVPGDTSVYKDVEVALYETRDDKDKVCGFYEDKMVQAGWDKAIFMPTDEGCVTTWLSKDGEIGATIVVGEQPDGKVFIWIAAGRTE